MNSKPLLPSADRWTMPCQRQSGPREERKPKNGGLHMPDFSTLTERQKEIYDFIRQMIEAKGYGPTVRNIGEHFGIKSPNGVMCHLKALEKKGLIVREEGLARTIQLVDYKPGPAAELP